MENEIILNGRVACKGYVEGEARLINEYKDLENIRNGDILVAQQTDMNYTLYLDKCVGIITERGGRFSHAAIYSRENSIPCITAVKGALESIIDGTKYILDANNNEIRRMK